MILQRNSIHGVQKNTIPHFCSYGSMGGFPKVIISCICHMKADI